MAAAQERLLTIMLRVRMLPHQRQGQGRVQTALSLRLQISMAALGLVVYRLTGIRRGQAPNVTPITKALIVIINAACPKPSVNLGNEI